MTTYILKRKVGAGFYQPASECIVQMLGADLNVHGLVLDPDKAARFPENALPVLMARPGMDKFTPVEYVKYHRKSKAISDEQVKLPLGEAQ